MWAISLTDIFIHRLIIIKAKKHVIFVFWLAAGYKQKYKTYMYSISDMAYLP